MTRFMVANSQVFALTRCVSGVFGWNLRLALLVCTVVSGFLAPAPKLVAQSAAVILVSVMDGEADWRRLYADRFAVVHVRKRDGS